MSGLGGVTPRRPPPHSPRCRGHVTASGAGRASGGGPAPFVRRRVPGSPLDAALPLIDLTHVGSNLASIAAAFVLPLPLGWERERSERSAGLRTFPLVAMASCGYILIASSVLGDRPEGRAHTGAIGAATALGRYEIALVLSAVNFAALRWLQAFKEHERHEFPEARAPAARSRPTG